MGVNLMQERAETYTKGKRKFFDIACILETQKDTIQKRDSSTYMWGTAMARPPAVKAQPNVEGLTR